MTTTIPLRELLREPSRVKKLTEAGYEVHVTDRGKALWKLTSDGADVEEDAAKTAARIADSWDDVLSELEAETVGTPPAVSAAQLLISHRREALR